MWSSVNRKSAILGAIARYIVSTKHTAAPKARMASAANPNKAVATGSLDSILFGEGDKLTKFAGRALEVAASSAAGEKSGGG
jgi:hypothetical protein